MSSAWKDWHLRKEGTVEPEVARLEELFNRFNVKSILDVGCGAGRHAIFFARKGFAVYGFDESADEIERAKQLLATENLKANLRVWNMTKLFPYDTAAFDAVIATRVIHHTYMNNITKIVSEIDRVLKKRGFIFLQVPSYESEIDDPTIPWVEPGTLIAREGPEKGVPHHFFRKDELLEIFSSYVVRELHSNSEHYGGYCLIAQKGRRGLTYGRDDTARKT